MIQLIFIKVWVGLVWFVGFYGILTFVGYLTPNPFLCKYVLFKTIQLSISTQFNCKYSLIVKKTFLFQAIQFSQTVLIKTIQFSTSMQLVLFNP